MHRSEQQDGKALGWRRGEEQLGERGVVGDPGGEIGVQRGVAGPGEVGEHLLAGRDSTAVALRHRRNVVDGR